MKFLDEELINTLYRLEIQYLLIVVKNEYT
jgi:hypothetical protein